MLRDHSAEWEEGDPDRNSGIRKDGWGMSEIGMWSVWLEGLKQGRER